MMLCYLQISYLDKFNKEFEDRDMQVIRYADDILLLKNIRAAERLLETSTRIADYSINKTILKYISKVFLR